MTAQRWAARFAMQRPRLRRAHLWSALAGILLGWTLLARTATEGTGQEASRSDLLGSTRLSAAAQRPRPLLSAVDVHDRRHGFYYKFSDVRLNRGSLDFFGPPEGRPTQELWYDSGLGNLTEPALPTVIVNQLSHDRQYIPVQYLDPGHASSACKGWVHQPALLLHVRWPNHVWHGMGEGLVGAFQTLREQGLLPLARVGHDLQLSEVAAGLGPPCRTVRYYFNGTAADRLACRNATELFDRHSGESCTVESDPRCRPGSLLVRMRRAVPVLVPDREGIVDGVQWSELYRAITEDIRPLPQLEGWCFRELIVGKTDTLDFYNSPLDHEQSGQEYQELRAEATRIFQEFASAALLTGSQPSATEYQGYASPGLEPLRRGIGPEQVHLLAALLEDRPDSNSFRKLGASLPGNQSLAARLAALGSGPAEQGPAAAAAAGAGSSGAGARPAVTYMRRLALNRDVLNEAELLALVLSSHDVTLHVTSLEEPLADVVALMGRTDLLLGMHGGAWANALFLKRGAAALQLFPYGWGRPGSRLRGYSYGNVVLAHGGPYFDWGNTKPENAFFREKDFLPEERAAFAVHPDPGEPLPSNFNSMKMKKWTRQNTWVDLADIQPTLFEALAAAGARRLAVEQ